MNKAKLEKTKLESLVEGETIRINNPSILTRMVHALKVVIVQTVYPKTSLVLWWLGINWKRADNLIPVEMKGSKSIIFRCLSNVNTTLGLIRDRFSKLFKDLHMITGVSLDINNIVYDSLKYMDSKV